MIDKAKDLSWESDPLWYRDAIIYQLHVKAYGDSNNDGYGDFRGLIDRLDYVQDLGINTLWLLPFYPSPLRDDGYDIADYKNIHPQYGTRRDFRQFVREAHKRDLKIITELVVNHTSDQHPWFQAARQAPRESRKRNFYVWSDDDRKWSETRIIFTDTETSNWAWDPVAEQYYWHRFFSHQPDLNYDNPDVVKAVIKIMRFWLDMGVDGLRLDAIPYLVQRDGTGNENLPETHAVIKQMRAVVDANYQNCLFLAEANQWPEDVREYFGDGDECHMAYHFPLMPRMYMAVAMEDRHPIIEIMNQTPDIPEQCQWAIFLRNHDELTLEMVTDKERDYMYHAYATDSRMKINVGIRRRLASLMDNDLDKIRLMNSMLMSMPGTPIIYYGDEIGMGDNIYLGDRNSVRTPMQWSPDRNAGFSRADPQKLYLPVIMDPIYGYEALNVEAQARSPTSMLNWMKRLIAVRKSSKAFGRGTQTFLHPGNRKILAYVREYENDTVLCVFNLARSAQPVELDLSRFKGLVPVELMSGTPFPPIGELPYLLTLPRYHFYWFRLDQKTEAPVWHEEFLAAFELPVLVLIEGWKGFLPKQFETRRAMAEKMLGQLERDILPVFLENQRWFADKKEKVRNLSLKQRDLWQGDGNTWLLTQIQAEFESGESRAYFLPLAIAWEQGNEEFIRSLESVTMARVREHARMGVLYDAFADEVFCRAIVKTIGENRELGLPGGRLKFSATRVFQELVGESIDALPTRRLPPGGASTGVVLGERLFLKGYRRLQSGVSPELEIGRFLTEMSPFTNIVPVAGALEYFDSEGTPTTLALLQARVLNQGDAWTYTLDYLRRALEDALLQIQKSEEVSAKDLHAVNLMLMKTLGRRTGELHVALARRTADPAFDPEPITAQDMTAWTQQVHAETARGLDDLGRMQENLPDEIKSLVGRVLAARHRILGRIASLEAENPQAVKTRYHGNFHLGQALVAEHDFIITNFDGELLRPWAERSRKHSPLRDVAGMLRSLDHAAHATLSRMSEEKIADLEHLEPLAEAWRREASEAFLTGYEQAVAGCPSYPANPAQARNLIDLFSVERIVHELRDELADRPSQVWIPLGGLWRWLAGE